MLIDSGVGNLSTSEGTKRQLSNLRAQLFEAGQMLSSGKKSESHIAASGKTNELYIIDNELKLAKSYDESASTLEFKLDAVQQSLQSVREVSSKVSLGVLSALGEQSRTGILSQAATANDALASVVSSLNRSVAGQALFSGARSDASSVVSHQKIVDDVEAILVSATDTNSAMALVDYYFFDPSGGFETTIYSGSSIDSPAILVSNEDSISLDIRADAKAIRETLKSLAVTAAISSGTIGSNVDFRDVLSTVGKSQLQTNSDLTKLQQNVGQKQEHLALIRTKQQAHTATIELIRNEITAIDTFEVTTQFEESRVLLETSYQVVARLSKMSLANFL